MDLLEASIALSRESGGAAPEVEVWPRQKRPARLRRDDLNDSLWHDLRAQAATALASDPSLGDLLWPTVLARHSLAEAVTHRIADRLASPALTSQAIRDAFATCLDEMPEVSAALRHDLRAVLERDPVADRVLHPVLHFKGFHALQAHRLAHWLWTAGRRDFALLVQSVSSQAFATDIHPAAKVGSGVFLDHATCFVAGETVVIEDNVSILQGVTLGGTGTERRDRHPKVRHGSLLGAGAKIIGPVEIGSCSRVAAGSVVLADVPPCTTVAGVPARVVGTGGCAEPGRDIEQLLGEAAYASFTYVI